MLRNDFENSPKSRSSRSTDPSLYSVYRARERLFSIISIALSERFLSDGISDDFPRNVPRWRQRSVFSRRFALTNENGVETPCVRFQSLRQRRRLDSVQRSSNRTVDEIVPSDGQRLRKDVFVQPQGALFRTERSTLQSDTGSCPIERMVCASEICT